METKLSFAVPAGKIATTRAAFAYGTRQRTLQKAPERPPAGAGDPAVEVGGPERFVPIARSSQGRSRSGFVDAVVTLSVMAAFAGALALLAGEWLGAPTGRSMQALVTKIAPSTSPHVAAVSGPAFGAEPRAM